MIRVPQIFVQFFCCWIAATNLYALDGKSLFFSQKAKPGGAACVGCHPISYVDTFTFTPSAYDLAASIKNSVLLQDDFISKINESFLYSSRMSECHEGYNLSADTLAAIMQYLAGLEESKYKIPLYPVYSTIFMVGGPLVIILLLIIRFKYRVMKILLVVISGIITLVGFTGEMNKLNYRKGYSPDQPIKFSHKTHAGDNKINCLFCHYSARHSKTAGIPSTALCMNCHLVIREGENSGAYELNKLFRAWDSSQPLEWIRVNELPVFAKFSHARHLRNNKTNCADCHGKVEDMHRIVQSEILSMQWCITCHSRTDQGYDKTLAEIRYRHKGKEFTATNYKKNCMTCHH